MAKKGSSSTRKNKLANDFCSCIKKVRKTIKLRPGQAKTKEAREAAAIAVCVKSVLQTKGRTLKKFRCTPKKATLVTQKPLRGGAVLVGTETGTGTGTETGTEVSENEFLEEITPNTNTNTNANVE